ncbi:hypothetical protein [Eubacterium ramulus]|uniref:hypothetical protein n=1 Tax=Eubacterium ramulus TaxID=39490 RepID=UPI003F497ED2
MGTGHQRKTGSLRYLTTETCVSCGITRPYLSDIETSKAHPSEALQEAISEALERFNPDNPLEMLFDYVRIRFPTTDVKHIVEDVLRLKLPLIHEDYGFYICKVAMDDERKDYFKALSRQCKRETLFCDMDNYTVNLPEDTLPFPYF